MTLGMLRKVQRLAGLVVALGVVSGELRAADELPPAQNEAAADVVADRAPELGLVLGDVWLTPFVAPAYTPELGFLLSAGGMLSFRADPKSPRSSVPMSVSYSASGALVLDARVRSYLAGDRVRFDIDVWSKDMVDHYFGATYPAARDTELGEDTRYHRRSYQLKPVLLGRVMSSLFAGALLDINRTEATEMSSSMEVDPAVVTGGSAISNVGSGPMVRFDTRDFPQNAFDGMLLQGSFAMYRTVGVAQSTYQVLDLDYRQYLPLPRATLAWNVRARHGFGDVPWTELGGVGSPYDLRGYRWGRYRQKAIAYGIVEYRHRFVGAPSELGRHGAVAWVGLGTLGADYTSLEGVLPNVGVGYRLVVQDRLNARLDVGLGRGERALYFNFSEAF
jgi:hypothetical protein